MEATKKETNYEDKEKMKKQTKISDWLCIKPGRETSKPVEVKEVVGKVIKKKQKQSSILDWNTQPAKVKCNDHPPILDTDLADLTNEETVMMLETDNELDTPRLPTEMNLLRKRRRGGKMKYKLITIELEETTTNLMEGPERVGGMEEDLGPSTDEGENPNGGNSRDDGVRPGHVDGCMEVDPVGTMEHGSEKDERMEMVRMDYVDGGQIPKLDQIHSKTVEIPPKRLKTTARAR